jgi:hypothetical protein
MAVLDAEPEPYFTLRPAPKKNLRLRNTDHKVLKKTNDFLIFCNSVPSPALIFATVYLRHRFRRYFRPAAARGTDSDPKLNKIPPLVFITVLRQ